MKKFLFVVMMIAVPSLASAEEVVAKVKGLVCAYCAQGIEKAFMKNSAVEHVMVDLDAGLVTLHTKAKGDVSDSTIKEIVTEAGFNLSTVERK